MILHPDVAKALQLSLPVVALESAVITHGLPHPINLELAQHLEDVIRQNGAAPATIALLEGELHIGITNEELRSLAAAINPVKISRRDFAPAMTQKRTGGTTVAGTMIAAHRAGIRVFATGGIGGVHRGTQFDVSADLPELAQTPLVVVCAGAKAILDLPATVEYLETMGVPMIGYQTDEFPAFYSQSSGIKIPFRVETPV
ncbi:MAG TPA: pseudouridine-5'-phosphate glycosidase, partial [Anaerolineaceae bacterium]|nr:pseudouridine-5'-phosphate glycosidase [Anaerolineaceae bacterium]